MTGKMDCTPILPVKVSARKIKVADHKKVTLMIRVNKMLLFPNSGSGQRHGYRSRRLHWRKLSHDDGAADDELVPVHDRKPQQQVTVRQAGAAGQYSESEDASDITEQ